MTPRAAYDDTAGRGRRLVRLHDGLINIRKRGIRRDWREAFCRLMRWPLQTDIERVDGKDAVIVLREGAELIPDDFSAKCLDDLLRSALTFAVSALDRYVHERVNKKIVAALKKSELNRPQEEFFIPAVLAIRITQAVADARKNEEEIRPANEVRKKIQEELHKRPFQSWPDIERAFQLIGISSLAGKLQSIYRVADFKPISSQLSSIVERRNYIVHEGDLVRHARGGNVKVSPISRIYVTRSMDFLDEFVTNLEEVT